MKTAKELINLATVYGGNPQTTEQIVFLMREYAKQAIEMCSRNACMKHHCGTHKKDTKTRFHQMGADNIQIDKQSILDSRHQLT